MSFLSKLLGGQPADAGRTPRERARRSREIRKIDAGTDRWLKAGGIHPRKGR